MNKKINILLLVLLVIALILLVTTWFINIKESILKIVSASPTDQAKNVSVLPKITLEFNRPLKNVNEVTAVFSPQIKFIPNLENQQKTLLLIPQEYLTPNTSYTLEIKSTKNEILWHSIFTTEQLQGNPQIPADSEKYTRMYYPLLEFVPYETEGFWVTYSGPLALKVTIKKGSSKTLEPNVIQWIKNHGVDPSSHQIRWITPEP